MPSIVHYSDAHHRTQVVHLWETVFGYRSEHNTPALSIDKKRAIDDGLFFVAILDDVVIGTVLAGYDGHRGWLYSVAVHPAHRQRGLGTAMLRHAETSLSALGCMKINLQVVSSNEEVVAFYESLGYVVEPRLSMGKKIISNIPIPEALQ